MPALVDISRRGFLVVLSSPSGAGKTTLTRMLLDRDPALALSVSVTTRKPRANEADGVHYHFIGQDRFDELVATGGLLEYATVFGNSYGTPRVAVETALEAGRIVIGDLDWQGARQLRPRLGLDLVTIFILPPSVEELERRLTARNQDSPEVVAARMAKALGEIEHWGEYEYVLVNRDLDDSLGTLEAILRAERARRDRQSGLGDFVRRVTAAYLPR